MGFGWTHKTLSPIGIDFGSDSVKILQVHCDEPLRIAAAAKIDIPVTMHRNSDEALESVAASLKNIIKQGGFRGKRVVASIAAAQTLTQHIRMTPSPGVAIEQQVAAELRSSLPADPASMVIRHVSVGDVIDHGETKHEAICFAAHRDYVMKIVELVGQAGCEVVGMHCEPLAIIEAFSHLFRRKSDVHRTTMFLDMGAFTTKAIIAHCSDLVFAKTIGFGGDQLIEQLGQRMNLDFEKASEVWRHGAGVLRYQPVVPGVAATTDQGMPMIDDLAAQQGEADVDDAVLDDCELIEDETVEADLSPPSETAVATTQRVASSATKTAKRTIEVMEMLMDELQMCLHYHRATHPDRPVDKIVFLGGESRHTSMCQRIAKTLRLPAQLGDPLARLERTADAVATNVELTEAQPGWGVPLGLCLLKT